MNEKVKYFKACLLTFLVRNILRRPFRVKDRNGFTFILLPEEHIFSFFYKGYLGYPEISEQECCKKLIHPGMTVFDAGANIGQFCLLFDSLVRPHGRVYAFEACQTTFARLKKHIEINAAQNIVAEHRAVYHQDNTKIKLNIFPPGYSVWNTFGHPYMHSREDKTTIIEPIGQEWVNTITIDEYCSRNTIDRIDYLKVDVEGAEIYVLKGCKALLKQKAIRRIQFEVSKDMNTGLGFDGTEVFTFLSELGYVVRSISPSGHLDNIVQSPSKYFQNFVALPE